MDTRSENSTEQLRDERIGADRKCGNCAHAYPLKVSITQTLLVCREGPPPPPLIRQDNFGRVTATPQDRMVQEDHFCAHHKVLEPKLHLS